MGKSRIVSSICSREGCREVLGSASVRGVCGYCLARDILRELRERFEAKTPRKAKD